MAAHAKYSDVVDGLHSIQYYYYYYAFFSARYEPVRRYRPRRHVFIVLPRQRNTVCTVEYVVVGGKHARSRPVHSACTRRYGFVRRRRRRRRSDYTQCARLEVGNVKCVIIVRILAYQCYRNEIIHTS